MSWIKQAKDIVNGQNEGHACMCLGPQDGEPVCPCAMRSVFKKGGRYKQITDLGPVNPESLIDRDRE